MDMFSKLNDGVLEYPEMKYIIDTITDIIEYISTDEMIQLKKENPERYKINLMEKYAEFSDKQYSLFSIILAGEFDSLDKLVTMLNTLCLVKQGKINMDTAYAGIREVLSEEYIYPQFGGKEKFEKTMIERSKHKKK